MKWMVPVNQLDAVQLQAIDDIVKPRKEHHVVKGFAGSGKTIVLTHVIERLASAKSAKRVCFATFTHALKDMVESGLSEQAREMLDITTFDSIGKLTVTYDVVVVDELQDVKPIGIREIQSRGKRIVASADFDQRIYRMSCAPAEIDAMLHGATEHELQEIHRVNFNVFEVATSVLPSAGRRSDPLVRDDGETTRLIAAKTKLQEFTTVYDEAVRIAEKGQPSAILLPSNALLADFVEVLARDRSWGLPPALQSPTDDDGRYGRMNRYLKQAKSRLQVFGSRSGEMAASDRQAIVYLMTYHASKGLDFPNVFLPHLTSSTKLDPMKGVKDEEERRLFFVAVTRAKRRLFLSYHGTPHRFLDEIGDELLVPFKKPKRSY